MGDISASLLVVGAVMVVVGYVMRSLRKITVHHQRRLVGMTWAQIKKMRSRQNWFQRQFYQRAPRPRGGTTVMLVGAALLAAGVLGYLASA